MAGWLFLPFLGPLGYHTALFTLMSRTRKGGCHLRLNWISELSNRADMDILSSHHVRDSGFRNARNFGWWNQESRKMCKWNPESTFHWQRLESSTWNLETTAWNPESKTVLDSLIWGDKAFKGIETTKLFNQHSYMVIIFFAFVFFIVKLQSIDYK